jgi:hypothetical protein
MIGVPLQARENGPINGSTTVTCAVSNALTGDRRRCAF